LNRGQGKSRKGEEDKNGRVMIGKTEGRGKRTGGIERSERLT